MGVDPGEGKGAIDATDDEDADAIDAANEETPGGVSTKTIMEKNAEETDKLTADNKCVDQGDEVSSKVVRDRSATTDERLKWDKDSDGIVRVPYIISSAFSRDDKANIDRAFKEYARSTCIR